MYVFITQSQFSGYLLGFYSMQKLKRNFNLKSIFAIKKLIKETKRTYTKPTIVDLEQIRVS